MQYALTPPVSVYHRKGGFVTSEFAPGWRMVALIAGVAACAAGAAYLGYQHYQHARRRDRAAYYDEGRIAGFIAGAHAYAKGYQGVVSRN